MAFRRWRWLAAGTGAAAVGIVLAVHPGAGRRSPAAAHPVPETPYYGYLLASVLARPGAHLAPLTTSRPGQVLAFQSARPDGKHAVAFINLDTSIARTATFPAVTGLTGTLRGWRYSAGDQNAAHSRIVEGSVSAAAVSKGITLSRESVTVLERSSPRWLGG